jgi:hypothetical protein
MGRAEVGAKGGGGAAKWALIAQVVLLVAGLAALLMKELPGLKREIRIMRMVGIGPRQG